MKEQSLVAGLCNHTSEPQVYKEMLRGESGQTAAEDVLQFSTSTSSTWWLSTVLAVNSSWVGLQLETGSDADCPISSFIMMFSTCVYLSHLPLNKLIIKKLPSEQQNNLNLDTSLDK